MADLKISALTSASTPLAGTEVLPIVQSSTTVKVATNDLTVRNIRAAATTGILQVSGPTASSTRTVTVPDANWTAARTDAAQSFTGDQTLSTGDVIQGTAAKGFNFTANTPAAGMTSQLLNWYEQGTWTPIPAMTSGSLTTYFSNGYYARVGRLVTLNGNVSIQNWGTGTGNLLITSIPFTSSSAAGSYNAGTGREDYSTGFQLELIINPSSTQILVYKYDNSAGITGTGTIRFDYYFTITYMV